MRIVSWLVVISSLVWLASSAWGPLMSALDLPPVESERAAGTAAPDAPRAEAEPDSGLAQTPYASVYPGLLMAQTAAELDRVDARVVLRTNRQGLSPEDIELTVDDGSEVHRYGLGPRGEVLIPARTEWRDAGLVVKTNQPVDSVRFTTVLAFRELTEPRLPYAGLWEMREQMQTVMDAMQAAGAGEREVLGLALRYPPGASATVRVLSDRLGEEYAADPRGVIRMPLSEALRDENPEVLFEPLPAQLMPLMR
jgi:hypothetical protein